MHGCVDKVTKHTSLRSMLAISNKTRKWLDTANMPPHIQHNITSGARPNAIPIANFTSYLVEIVVGLSSRSIYSWRGVLRTHFEALRT